MICKPDIGGTLALIVKHDPGYEGHNRYHHCGMSLPKSPNREVGGKKNLVKKRDRPPKSLASVAGGTTSFNYYDRSDIAPQLQF